MCGAFDSSERERCVISSKYFVGHPTIAAADRPTVLLVEDNAGVRMVLARALQRSGFAVLEAETAEAASAILGERTVDGVVSDVTLDGSVSGAALGRWIRRHAPSLPLLLITGLPHGAVARQIAGDPFSAVLCKPFSAGALVQRLRALLASAPAD